MTESHVLRVLVISMSRVIRDRVARTPFLYNSIILEHRTANRRLRGVIAEFRSNY